MVEPAHTDGSPRATDDNWISLGQAVWRVLGKARRAQKAREKGADTEERGNVVFATDPVKGNATRRPGYPLAVEEPGELEPHAAHERTRHDRRSTDRGSRDARGKCVTASVCSLREEGNGRQ